MIFYTLHVCRTLQTHTLTWSYGSTTRDLSICGCSPDFGLSFLPLRTTFTGKRSVEIPHRPAQLNSNNSQNQGNQEGTWEPDLNGREKLCTADIELLVIFPAPLLPPQRNSAFHHFGIHPPRANAAKATEPFTSILHKLEQLSPDSPKLILGDFNHCLPDKSLKGFQQYVTRSTRQGKTLEKCYGSVPDAFKALHPPPSRLCGPLHHPAGPCLHSSQRFKETLLSYSQ